MELIKYTHSFIVNRNNKDVEIIKKFQSIRNHSNSHILDKYFFIASFLAEEDFYLITLPFIFWNIDWNLGHHLLHIINIGLYIGNLLKITFEIPRPSNVWIHPTLIKTDSSNLKDYGFPSTHSMNAISNTLYITLYNILYNQNNQILIPILLSCVWALSIMLSRLYLGVHTPCDVIGGALLGLFVATVWLYIGFYIDMLCISLGPLYVLMNGSLLCAILLYYSIKTTKLTTTTIQMVVNLGIIMGNSLGVSLYNPSNNVYLEKYTMLRYLIGMPLVLLIKTITKKISIKIYNLLDIKGNNAEQTECFSTIFQKYTTYVVLAFSVTTVIPYMYNLIGL